MHRTRRCVHLCTITERLVHAYNKSIPKKLKVKVRAQTQDELIARALDMEEGNIFEHRNYLSVEEEKRRRALAVRIAISGPLLRWVSRREKLSLPSEDQLSGMFGSHDFRNSMHILNPGDGRNGAPSSTPGDSEAKPEVQQQPAMIPAKLHTENVTKNYVIHEVSQDESATRPPWKDTMTAMFGSHVKWEDVRAYVSRGRPLCELYHPPRGITLTNDLNQPDRRNYVQ